MLYFMENETTKKRNECEQILNKIAGGYVCRIDGKNDFIFFSVRKNFNYDDFIHIDEKSLNTIAKESVDLYDTVKKAQNALKKI